MQWKHKAMILLAIIMLMGAMLAGCGGDENENDSTPIENVAPPRDRDRIPPHDPDATPPPRNPDGTLG